METEPEPSPEVGGDGGEEAGAEAGFGGLGIPGMDNLDLSAWTQDMDEEGMVNFLTDALGGEVGTELLKEFAQSNAFAEILESVTTSLVAGANNPEEQDPPGNGQDQGQDQDPPQPECGPSLAKSSAAVGANRNSFSIGKSEEDLEEGGADPTVSNKAAPSTSTTTTTETLPIPKKVVTATATATTVPHPHQVQTEQSAIIPGSFEASIKVMDIIPPYTKPKKPKDKSLAHQSSSSHKVKEDTKGHDKDKDKKRAVTKIKLPNLVGGDFLKYKRRFHLKLCSVIICDLVKLGSAFQNLKSVSGGGGGKSAKPLAITRAKIKEVHREEKVKRQDFRKKLKSIGGLDGKREEGNRVSISKTDNNRTTTGTEGTKRRHSVDDSENENRKKRKEKVEEFSAGGTRILPFEKRRDVNQHNRDRQREIVRPKPKEVKPEKAKESIKSALQLKEELDRRCRASLSFRIPKNQNQNARTNGPLHKQPLPQRNAKTPLERHSKPENMVFERRPDRKVVPVARVEPQHKIFKDLEDTDFGVNPDNNFAVILPNDASGGGEDNRDDGPDGPEDDDEVGEEAEDRPPPPPIEEVRAGSLAHAVVRMLAENTTKQLLLLEQAKTLTDFTVQKCALFFRGAEEDPVDPEPYVAEEEESNLYASLEDSDDHSSVSSFEGGNVSDPDGTQATQINVVSSTGDDTRHEFCGCSLLKAQYRTTAEGNFKSIFYLRPGSNYDKENFQANCCICDKLIVGKTQLSAHVISTSHRKNLQDLSLRIPLTSPYKVFTMSNSGKSQGSSSADLKSTHSAPKSKSGSSTGGGGKDGRKNGSNHGSQRGSQKGRNGTSTNAYVSSSKQPKVPEAVDRVARDPNYKSISNTSSIRSAGSGSGAAGIGRQSRAGTVPPGTEEEPNDTAPKASQVPRRNSRPSRSPRPRHRPRSRSRSPGGKRRSRSRSNSRRGGRGRGRRTRSRSRSRSRNRHPRRRTRSRSRTPRSGLGGRVAPPLAPAPTAPPPVRKDPVDEFLERTNRPRSRSPQPTKRSSRRTKTRSRSPKIIAVPELKRKINQIFNEKLALQHEGKWTAEMESNFKRMEEEEAVLAKEFDALRKVLTAKPEDHPKYPDEWKRFWEKKYQEVETSGGDAEHYDYVPEWKAMWNKRVEVLFELDYNAKLDGLRLKYGMDYESLHKTRGGLNVLNSIPAQSPQSLTGIPLPSPLHLGDDLETRSMSISDIGSQANSRASKQLKKDETPAVGPKAPPPPTVTVQDVQAIWQMMTGTKVTTQPQKSDVLSIASSGSGSNHLFDGFDLVQVLQLMDKLEDQLSFMAPQVKMYFQKAEEMDIAKARASYALLEDADFVNLLFKCRDRFNALIKAAVVGGDILSAINLTVYRLNLVLDSPKCQKLRARTQSVDLEVPPAPQPEVVAQVPKAPSLPRGPSSTTSSHLRPRPPILPVTDSKPEPEMPAENELEPELEEDPPGDPLPLPQILSKFTIEQKVQIADLLAEQLDFRCLNTISDEDLMQFVIETLDPVARGLRTPPGPSRAGSLSPTQAPALSVTVPNNLSNNNQPPPPPPPNAEQPPPPPPLPPNSNRNNAGPGVLSEAAQNWRAGDENSAARRTVGTALPFLPTPTATPLNY